MATPPKVLSDDPKADGSVDADAPMAIQQADILRVLCEEAGEPFDGSLTQGQAMERINYLREKVNSEQNL